VPFVNHLPRILNSFSFIAAVVFASALLTSIVFPSDPGHGQFIKSEILVNQQAGLPGKERLKTSPVHKAVIPHR
jgi:hypothetical protein